MAAPRGSTWRRPQKRSAHAKLRWRAVVITAAKDPAFALAIQISLHVVRTLQELNFIANHADKSSTNGNFTMPSAGCIYGYMRVLFYPLKLEPECCVHLHETLAIPEGECAGNSRWKSEEDACWCLTSCYQVCRRQNLWFCKNTQSLVTVESENFGSQHLNCVELGGACSNFGTCTAKKFHVWSGSRTDTDRKVFQCTADSPGCSNLVSKPAR